MNLQKRIKVIRNKYSNYPKLEISCPICDYMGDCEFGSVNSSMSEEKAENYLKLALKRHIMQKARHGTDKRHIELYLKLQGDKGVKTLKSSKRKTDRLNKMLREVSTKKLQ